MNIEKYIGIPFKNGGRSLKGIDCYGLIWLIYKNELGIELPDFMDLCYTQGWYKDSNIIEENIDSKKWIRVYPPFRKFDGLLFYDTSNSDIASHIGMVVDNKKFIHITHRTKSMISVLDNRWNKILYGGMRYNGLSNI